MRPTVVMQGLNPVAINGLFPIPSWSGDAVKIKPARNRLLAYPKIRTNGSAVVTFPFGGIRFWFKPDWSSFSGEREPGPGDVVRWFEMGRQTDDASYGWFALTIDRLGTTLNLSTEANSVHTDNAKFSKVFDSKSWYQIVLAYTTSNSVLFVNGQRMMTNGFGLTNIPSQNVLNQGFHLGGSWGRRPSGEWTIR